VHLGESSARIWSFENKVLDSTKALTPPAHVASAAGAAVSTKGLTRLPRVAPVMSTVDLGSPLQASWLTPCGNFAFVGASNGQVHRFNIQSGLFRATLAEKGHGWLRRLFCLLGCEGFWFCLITCLS
jgi:hypothetical protein